MDKLKYELTYCVDTVKDICARHGVSVVSVNKKIGTRAQLREHVTKDTLMTYQEIIDRDYPVIATEPEKAETEEFDFEAAANLSRKLMAEREMAIKETGQFEGQNLWHPEEDFKKAGWRGYWGIDYKGRLDILQMQGYHLVTKSMMKRFPKLALVQSTDPGEAFSVVVHSESGEPIRQYLMMRPEDIHQRTLLKKRKRNFELAQQTQQVKGSEGIGSHRTPGGESVMYDPTGGRSQFDV